MSEIDWSALQTEAKTAGVIPPGEYTALIISAEATTSSTGKPMIKYKARITDGPQANKPIWSQFTISADSAMALRMYFMQMAALGLDTDFFAKNPSLADVARNLVNRAANFVLVVEPWQGQDRSKVNGVKALPAGAPLPPGVVTGPGTVGGTPGSSTTPMNAPTPTSAPAVAPTPTSTPPVPTAPVAAGSQAAPPATPF